MARSASLGASFTEELNRFSSSDQQWQSLNGFAARLRRDGTLKGETYALWAMRDALEIEPDHRARAYHTQGPLLDHNVPVAAEWISIAGLKLFLCEEDYSSSAKAGWQWKGKNSFSRERWQFWAQRFENIGENEQAAPQTREVAKQAAGKMRRIQEDVEKERSALPVGSSSTHA